MISLAQALQIMQKASRGICDELNKVITFFFFIMPQHDVRQNNIVIDKILRAYDFICEIKIDNDLCEIKYDIVGNGDVNCISFSLIPEELKRKTGKRFYSIICHSYCFEHLCHSVACRYLISNPYENVCAVTSICVNINNYRYFHSYIWDVDNDLIYDFARNIIMRKSDYDFIFVDYNDDKDKRSEINILDYESYRRYLHETDYYNYGEDYCRLLYLALVKLYNEENENKYSNTKKKTI